MPLKITKQALILLLNALFLFKSALGSGPAKGFKALSIYDYFKAKKAFYKDIKKAPKPASAYGLALIYARTDNPFSNSDSALKYVNLSYNYFIAKPKKQAFSGFTIDSTTILSLVDSIARQQLKKAKQNNSIQAYNRFLTANYLANQSLIKQVVFSRDELEFNQVLKTNKSDSTTYFMNTHPQSSFYNEARLLKERQLYDELTLAKTAIAYQAFIDKYPQNSMIGQAYEKLFSLYRQQASVPGLALFVKKYPNAPQHIEAWKLLFSLSVKAYSFSELKRFLEDYPGFPLKNSILKELELNKLVLYPYQQGDFTGFINEEGRFTIAAQYDAATDFYDGLSVVTKNDSVYYINKENINPFGVVYTEALPFRNGIAAVKNGTKWHFINRQGQTVSKHYDEINELSNSVYVVKLNERYGALDQYGQTLIEPKYDKLGDFKNDMAYYLEHGTYGFVSINGTQHKAEFEWISDFDEQQLAIIKKGNKYGLINSRGNLVLEPQYDQINKAGPQLFMVVSNTSYGFFNARGCFVTGIFYDYSKDKSPDYYTNGKLFRLLKKNGQSIVDENGNTVITTEHFSEINFMTNGLIKVKKKKKYGFVNHKLNVEIPFRYEEASDFSDSLAMVMLKGRYLLINTEGKEIFSDLQPIKKISPRLYELNSEPKTIIDNRGEVVLSGVSEVTRLNKKLLIISLANGEIKLIND